MHSKTVQTLMKCDISTGSDDAITGADPVFLERGLICIKVGGGFALQILSNFS